jgi:hypothetical protein
MAGTALILFVKQPAWASYYRLVKMISTTYFDEIIFTSLGFYQRPHRSPRPVRSGSPMILITQLPITNYQLPITRCLIPIAVQKYSFLFVPHGKPITLKQMSRFLLFQVFLLKVHFLLASSICAHLVDHPPHPA